MFPAGFEHEQQACCVDDSPVFSVTVYLIFHTPYICTSRLALRLLVLNVRLCTDAGEIWCLQVYRSRYSYRTCTVCTHVRTQMSANPEVYPVDYPVQYNYLYIRVPVHTVLTLNRQVPVLSTGTVYRNISLYSY